MRWWLIGLLLVPVAAHAEPCCGPITPQGRQLARFLDDSGVDHLWLAGWHIDWATGEADREEPGGPEAKTHCSAFAAAMAERLRTSIVLRPPDHAQALLANAQMRWLRDHGAEQGWQELASPVEAQAAANRGELVLEAFENPDPRKPGHIAIVRPSDEDARRARPRWPAGDAGRRAECAQHHHRRRGSVTTPARGCPAAGGALRYYAHAVDWS